MPVTKTDASEAILLAMLDRLGAASGDAAGNVDEATQEDVDAIASLADGAALDGLVEDLNRPLPGIGRTSTTNELSTPPPVFKDEGFDQ